ncbi:MAG: acyl-CoA synthetase [Halioglobus sp.]|nr:acyl-CoA synthetase [Halioglobus sp.]
MLALSSLNATSYPQSHPIAMASQGVVCWGQFVCDVVANQVLLEEAGCSRWALFEEDGYRLAVGLCALWSIGAEVYLPGDNHRSVVSALKDENLQFLGVFPTVSDRYEIVVSSVAGLDADFELSGELVVFTSGSSGKPKGIRKQMSQLDAELSSLETMWGELLTDSIIMSTVSHQHLYGLIFSVLWPLCSGRTFWRRPFIDPLSMCREASALPGTAWIMSPAHLHRLSPKMPWHEVSTSLSTIFSSGGALNLDAARSIFSVTGKLPVEVFGSSETGAIAWRQQAVSGQDWIAIPGVEVRCTDEGALAVRSPFLQDNEWYVTADGASMVSRYSFQLGKRLDRIVKIEGKRVSLPEVEELLLANEWIIDVVAMPLARRRVSVAVVFVLSDEGETKLASLGKREFISRLRAELSHSLSSVAVPRFYRMVPQLPRNSQGKLLYRDLERLFRPSPIPEVLSQEVSGTSCELCLSVSKSSPYFEGHFPSTPVLPGVAQILWAEHFGRELLGVRGLFRGLRAVKFREIIRPGSKLQLTLEYTEPDGRLQFYYRSVSGEHSQGRLMYGAES